MEKNEVKKWGLVQVQTSRKKKKWGLGVPIQSLWEKDILIKFSGKETEAMGSSVLEATQLSSRSSIVNQLCMNEAHSFFLIFEVPTFYFRVKDIKTLPSVITIIL